MKDLNRKCPICENKRGRALTEIKMVLPENIKLPESYDVVLCEKCGFVFADVDASQSQYDEYYCVSNMYSDEKTRIEKYDRLNKERVSFIKTFAKKKDSIIDIGCGSGTLLASLKEAGFSDLFGLDPSKESCMKLRDMGINSICGSIFDDIKMKRQYDLVLCTEVLEHVYDLKKIVLRLSALVKKNGFVFVDVPAIEILVKSPTPIADNFNCEHINYFTENTLVKLFETNGFRCIYKNIGAFDKKQNTGETLAARLHAIVFQYVGISIKEIQYDKLGEKAVISYLEKIKEKQELKQKNLKYWLRNVKKIVIWGSGNYAMQLLYEYPLIEDKIICFVDNNQTKWGGFLKGKEIKNPNYLKNIDCSILICSMNYYLDIEKECQRLKKDYYIY